MPVAASDTMRSAGRRTVTVVPTPPGQKAMITILRGGKRRQKQVLIGSQPKLDAAEAESDLGIHVQEITANLARDRRLDSDEGAFVVFVVRGSPAREAGLRVGDVIVRIEDEAVDDLEDFRKQIERVTASPRFLLTTRRGKETKYLLVKPGARPVDEEPDEEAGEVQLPDASAR